MKIVSYNVNGIRAAMRKDLISWLSQTDADVVCLQEIKANPDQFDETEFHDIGYKYCYWYPAQKKGYSGVALLCKTKPNHVEYGTGIATMDFEGRNIRADFNDVSVMSMYLPSGTNSARLDFKLNYMDEFLEYSKDLRHSIPNLVVCGDYNICHKPEDIHDPVRLKNVSGFLPVERDWLTKFIDSGFIDSFRVFNDQPENYTWWSYRANARANNKGWRLDYLMVTPPLQEKLKRSVILKDAVHSDHCPVLLELDL
ncbi:MULTISPECIES: exodeoxyribonuclease III [Croceibacter]|jgi:exodeoxyribonuclease-3|uniref:exodeoxyribonuclease III n=1 Tax=Croceibacter TaxID=216431 RepID=UPI000C6176F5|nr:MULTISPECIES: exodeoxyribonuclease III [Croceibacter]MBG25890.1 exodeoxyribonuclease III [Croceibacter sp.]HAT69308.1 exodeoxyribonuclease III [Flavobacteriaceae bacterium]|tara:strand:+ start:321 stop:1085 length:765 start_codon:yes stop_codon:yes gene_type:complete